MVVLEPLQLADIDLADVLEPLQLQLLPVLQLLLGQSQLRTPGQDLIFQLLHRDQRPPVAEVQLGLGIGLVDGLGLELALSLA